MPLEIKPQSVSSESASSRWTSRSGYSTHHAFRFALRHQQHRRKHPPRRTHLANHQEANVTGHRKVQDADVHDSIAVHGRKTQCTTFDEIFRVQRRVTPPRRCLAFGGVPHVLGAASRSCDPSQYLCWLLFSPTVFRVQGRVGWCVGASVRHPPPPPSPPPPTVPSSCRKGDSIPEVIAQSPHGWTTSPLSS